MLPVGGGQQTLIHLVKTLVVKVALCFLLRFVKGRHKSRNSGNPELKTIPMTISLRQQNCPLMSNVITYFNVFLLIGSCRTGDTSKHLFCVEVTLICILYLKELNLCVNLSLKQSAHLQMCLHHRAHI